MNNSIRKSPEAKINLIDFIRTQEQQDFKQDECQTFKREQKKTSEDN